MGRCRPEWIALPGRLFNDSEHGISSVSGETGTRRIYREPSDSWGCSVLCMHIQIVIAVYLRLTAVVETIGRPRLGVSVERGITVTATRELGDLMCGAEHHSRQCALPLRVYRPGNRVALWFDGTTHLAHVYL